MNNKQNHTGPNYVTYIPKIQIPIISNTYYIKYLRYKYLLYNTNQYN